MTNDQLIKTLNDWDAYAEMSDDPNRGNRMYDDVRRLRPYLTQSKVNQIASSLNDNGKMVLDRYFGIKVESKSDRLRKVVREEVSKVLKSLKKKSIK